MRLKLLPLLSTTLLYALYYLISTFKFDVQILTASVPYDYLLQLVVAYVLYALSKRVWIFLVIHALLMGLLYVGNAVKISFFGGPIMPDDVFALQSLLLILDGWRFFAAAIPLAAIASLLLFNFTMRHWSAYLASLAVILLGITVVYKPAHHTGSSGRLLRQLGMGSTFQLCVARRNALHVIGKRALFCRSRGNS